MEFERKAWKLYGTLRSCMPSSVVEDTVKKLSFLYYFYKKYCEVNDNLDVAHAVSESCTKLYKLRFNILDYDDIETALKSGYEDLTFFSNDGKHSCDLVDLHLQFLDFTEDELLKLLNSKDERTFRDEATPDCVSDLVLKLADYYKINKERVTDMGCAKGDFLLNASKQFKIVEGVEHAENISLIAKMRLLANDLKGTIRLNGCFDDSWKHQAVSQDRLSDLVFSEFPWKLVVKDPHEREIMYNCNANRFMLQDSNTTDFFFMSAMMNYLKEDGVAIAVVPVSSLSNLSDKVVRQNIIERGFLKAVITLPANLFSRTGILTALVILSFNNKEITFFDGSKYSNQKNRTWNVIDVDALISDFTNNKEVKRVLIDSSLLNDHDYSFSPSHYLSDIKSIIPNATELENVADIFTGWQCTSSKLEEIHKKDGTGFQLLQMSNVENGSIVRALERYDIPESTVEKFKVQKGDVVISTKSLKVKSAVVDLDTEESIIASGSIMVIRPKEKKLNPYYLVSFFESAFGQMTLRMYQTGAVIPNLSIGNVKKLPLPCLDYNEQVRIGEEYRELRDSINDEKRRLEKLQEKASKLLDNLWDKKEG